VVEMDYRVKTRNDAAPHPARGYANRSLRDFGAILSKLSRANAGR
jgi:hypothetical protein